MKLSDIYNSICIDSSVENKNCILLKIVFYLRPWSSQIPHLGGRANSLCSVIVSTFILSLLTVTLSLGRHHSNSSHRSHIIWRRKKAERIKVKKTKKEKKEGLIEETSNLLSDCL